MKTQRIHLLFLILLIVTSLFWPGASALGQSTIHLTSVQVGLFPEYDRPATLVVLEIELSGSPPDPQTLIFKAPANAEDLSVFQRPNDGETVPLAFTVSTNDNWKDVSLSTNAQTLQIEYYDPNLLKEEDCRFYEYRWLSLYDVSSLSVTIRQPSSAEEIQTDPPLDTRETGPDGATYHTQEMGSIPAGEVFTLNLMYAMDSTGLAYPALPVKPAEHVSETTPGRTPSPLSVIMWLLTVAVAVLVLVSLYYWWFKSNVMEKRNRMAQGVGIINPEKQAVFCHECGMRSRPGDSYCSNCGTELRRGPEKPRVEGF